jgi:hypothetical protein
LKGGEFLGKVKIDIASNEALYRDLTFSDINVVKWLIQFRDKVDPHYKSDIDSHFNYAGNVKSLNQELINTYICLDELIDKCKFNKQQLYIISLIQEGYTYQEIAVELGKSKNTNIKNRFNKICRDIVKMNHWLWRKCIYVDKLGLKTKKCSKCEENLPATAEFFGEHSQSSDGFQPKCRNCDNFRKKRR